MIDSSDSIKLPALGRRVQVGDTYNYFSDTIVTYHNLKVPDDCIQIDCKKVPDTKLSFLCQKSEDFIYYLLDINSHLRGSIEEKTVQDLNPLWFSKYVNTKTNQDDEGRPDRIDVFLRVIRRTETLSQDFIESKLFNYQLQSGGKATHLVEQVSYGAEFICSVDLSQVERSKDNEDEILSTVKVCFQQILKFDSTNDIELPSELEKINCTLYSSLFRIPDAFNKGILYSLSDAIKSIKDIIHSTHREDPLKTWSPIEMNLRQIPSQLKAQIYIETIERSKLTFQLAMNLIKQQSRTLLKHSALNKVPALKQVLSQFLDLLQPLWNKIENNYSEFPLSYIPNQFMEQHKLTLELIKETEEWLDKISQQIIVFSLLLKDINLDILSFDGLESRAPTSHEKYAKVFVLKVDLVKDKLIDKIKKIICREEELNTATFPEFLVTVNTVNRIREMLIEFEGEALLRNWSDSNTGYYIGLVPANITELVDGNTTTIKYCAPFIPEEPEWENSSEIAKEPNEINCEVDDSMDIEQSQCIDFPEEEDMPSFSPVSDSFEDVRSNHTLTHYTNQDTESKATTNNEQNKQMSKAEVEEYQTNTISSDEEKSDHTTVYPKLEFDEENVSETEQRDVNDALFNSLLAVLGSNSENTEKLDQKQKHAVNKSSNKSKAGDSTDVKKNPKQKRVKTFSYDKRFQQAKEEETLMENQRIGDVFEKDKNAHNLIKEGKPSVYLLNAKESSISKDLRWFSVTNSGGVQSSLHHQNHKVVILMGATGCGKSTLINGMFNYILGVQWKDPIRYKVIREDESSTSRDQAHSQTSSVTAYTLEHQDGMTVPYSITIIDTPGYGDTRGIKRDKEITQTIHRFLSQSETQFDQIHAVCFVAASGDSRLTATQRYILDSVFSLFGKDVKDNIRLLVTFADSADPPVIEACMASHFPLTHQSSEIVYSKFNSSVLYASNQQSEEDDFSFDKLFWDMGQENFEKFFKMLEAMNGCDLASTREVIQRRQKAEHALKSIENEIDFCLIKIENIEKLQRKIQEHGRKMKTNQNFNIEIPELLPVLKECGMRVAYNCKKCKKTCQPPEYINHINKLGNDLSVMKKPECNTCNKCSKDDHDFQRKEWVQEEVIVPKTLNDMKTEYETNYKQKFSTENLLVKCTEDLEIAKTKVLSLLTVIEENSRSLDSTALFSNTLSPADYLSLMRSRVAEEQKPGYMIRLETLSELQRCLEIQTPSRQNEAVIRSSENCRSSAPKSQSKKK